MVYPGQLSYKDFSSTVHRRPIDDYGRRLRVVCVGAGISGITTAIRFNQHLGSHVDFKIYEKNDGQATSMFVPLWACTHCFQTSGVFGSRIAILAWLAISLHRASPGSSRTIRSGQVTMPAGKRSMNMYEELHTSTTWISTSASSIMSLKQSGTKIEVSGASA